MLLTIVLPGGAGHVETIREECERWAAPGTRIAVTAVQADSLTSWDGMARAAPAIVAAASDAAAAGSAGVCVLCSGDPAVQAVREVVEIPVVGGLRPSLCAALPLGHRIALPAVAREVAPIFRELLRQDGLAERCTIRTTGTAEFPLHNPEKAVEHLHRHAARMVAAAEADVIVLGCTAYIGAAAALQERLAAEGPYVPVIDPIGAAVTYLESAVRLGVRSGRTRCAAAGPHVTDATPHKC